MAEISRGGRNRDPRRPRPYPSGGTTQGSSAGGTSSSYPFPAETSAKAGPDRRRAHPTRPSTSYTDFRQSATTSFEMQIPSNWRAYESDNNKRLRGDDPRPEGGPFVDHGRPASKASSTTG